MIFQGLHGHSNFSESIANFTKLILILPNMPYASRGLKNYFSDSLSFVLLKENLPSCAVIFWFAHLTDSSRLGCCWKTESDQSRFLRKACRIDN